MTDLTPAAGVAYLPIEPTTYRPSLAIVGCGGISAMHLAAYRAAGYDVVAFVDVDISRAIARRDEFYPTADVYDSIDPVLERADIEVVDIATHVHVRAALIERALRAGKHVLSQKPFVQDFATGEALIELARSEGRELAVNQNGRWAPHFAFLLAAVRGGLIGTVTSADFSAYWAHDREVEHRPEFAEMPDLILYDFGIHWFDIIAQLFSGREATRVDSFVRTTPGQVISAPTSASTVIQFPEAEATVILRGASHLHEEGSYRIDGTLGVITHDGLALGGSLVRVETAAGVEEITIDGTWWTHGMRGTMGELLAAVESRRTPSNTAQQSMQGLALCFAAVKSSREGTAVDPREMTGLDR
jgi:predicted dehydrogenase